VRGKPIAVAAALESPFTGSPPRFVPASLSCGAQWRPARPASRLGLPAPRGAGSRDRQQHMRSRL